MALSCLESQQCSGDTTNLEYPQEIITVSVLKMWRKPQSIERFVQTIQSDQDIGHPSRNKVLKYYVKYP